MIYFWILAALLALLSAALVVVPFWRGAGSDEQDLLTLNRRVFRERLAELEKDAAENRIDAKTALELRTELERNLLALDGGTASVLAKKTTYRWTGWLALALLPIFALGFYYAVLRPGSLGNWWALKNDMGPVVDHALLGQPVSEAEAANHTLADFVRVLQSRLQQQPDNAEGWFMLGMSYMQMELAQPAQTAFEHAWRLEPGDPRHALALAQARMFSNDGQLDPTSQQLLTDVLAQQPQHEGALVLLGFGAYRSGDYATAVTMLERLQSLRAARHASGSPTMAQQLQTTLWDAREKLRLAQRGEMIASTGSAIVKVKVQVDRALAGKFAPDDALYVFARALNGPPMPLAVVKRRASDLPLTIELDDSQSMMPQRPLSSVQEIAVSARISRHSTPDPQSGDLEAIPVPVRQNGQVQSVELLIHNVHP